MAEFQIFILEDGIVQTPNPERSRGSIEKCSGKHNLEILVRIQTPQHVKQKTPLKEFIVLRSALYHMEFSEHRLK